MIQEIIVVSVGGLIVGFAISYILFKLGFIKSRYDKMKNQVINDPDLLLEKLNKHGELVDWGEKLEYAVIEKDGKRVLDVKKTAVKAPSSPVQPKKKVSKKKVVKKKVVKKGKK